MKRIQRTAALLISAMMLASLTAGCGNSSGPRPLTEAQRLSLWNDEYADSIFTDTSGVRSVGIVIDRQLSDTMPESISESDCKLLFYSDDYVRAVNVADGWAITLPNDGSLDFDYSLSALRSRFTTDSYTLNVSKEVNSYSKNPEGWRIYFEDWLVRFVGNDRFLHRNALDRTRDVIETKELLDGYIVHLYSVYIRENENIAQPYYNIAVVREDNDRYETFYLFNLKSNTDKTEEFDLIVASLREFEPNGTARNDEGPYTPYIPEKWNESTLRYYQRLQEQDHVSWGFFTNSMPDDDASYWNDVYRSMQYNQNFYQQAFEHTFEVIPTYLHIGWHGSLTGTPNRMFAEFAGGDGFNGKPVLHLSYQFTTSNNTGLNNYTPMFNVLNGYYDDHFRDIARDIRDYGYPVLFRLNNEMDTDWVSYAAIVTLLDPDIFIMTWERMYRIFEEEGVDNCIWIFNPFGVSIPFSNWGDWLCYLPDLKTVHVLGLTSYEDGNNDAGFRSFSTHYRIQYERHTPYFKNYPWSISEFGCGAGGAKREIGGVWVDTVLGRARHEQADWVRGMFSAFNRKDSDPFIDFLDNIKIAIWFSTNDYTPHQIDGQYHITNYYRITEDLTETIEEFRRGLNP
jgi:hypothetical protein